MRKHGEGASPVYLLGYASAITLMAVVEEDPRSLAVMTLLTGVPGVALGVARYGKLVALLALSIAGVFINAMMLYYLGAVENPGPVIAEIGPLSIPWYAVHSTLVIGLRITAIAGAGLMVSGLVNPRDVLRSLEEAGMPRGLAFSLAFAIRMLPLVLHEVGEVMATRRVRGYRRIPVTPGDFASIMLPLLSVAVERAIWVGVSAELRGFRSAPRRKKRLPKPGRFEALLLTSLAVQAAAFFAF